LSEIGREAPTAHFERMPIAGVSSAIQCEQLFGLYIVHRAKEKAASGGLVSAVVPAL